jgi:hypothetical protein
MLEQNIAFASRLATEALVLDLDLGRVVAVLDRDGIADPSKARAALMAVTARAIDEERETERETDAAATTAPEGPPSE